MLPIERQNAIVKLVTERKAITVDELCAQLYSSGATIRRDLALLEKRGMLRRTHGGAVYLESLAKDFPVNFRETENPASKVMIAERARTCIKDGQTLFLDASTTACQLASRLTGFHQLRVITNGLKTASILSSIGGITVYGTGGRLRENALSFIGLQAIHFIAQFHADVAFFSCRGIHPTGGVTDSSEEEANIKKQYLRVASRSILLCDSSKIGRQFFCKICDLTDVSEIISDQAELFSR